MIEFLCSIAYFIGHDKAIWHHRREKLRSRKKRTETKKNGQSTGVEGRGCPQFFKNPVDTVERFMKNRELSGQMAVENSKERAK